MHDHHSQNNLATVEMIALKLTKWIGSSASLVVHTVLFLFAFILVVVGIPFDRVLLVLTTIVSLEAIYLSIFIQMSVNRSESRLDVVSRSVSEIEKDVDEIQIDIDEIQEDVEGIEKDIDEIQEDIEEEHDPK